MHGIRSDHVFPVISGAEGNIGILYEHSPAEGPPVAVLCDFVEKQASVWPIPPEQGPCKPEALDFTTNVQVGLPSSIAPISSYK